MQAVLWVFAASALVVPSTTEDYDGDPSTFKPLLLTNHGGQFLAAFTQPDRIGAHSSNALAFVSMSGEDLLRRIPPNNGIAVNPGTAHGFELPAPGVAAIVEELARS